MALPLESVGWSSSSGAWKVRVSSPETFTVASTLFLPGLVKETVVPGSSTKASDTSASASAITFRRLFLGMGLTKYGSLA